MTTEEQINKLENRVKNIEETLSDQLDIMSSMNEELKKLNRGIYGDKENQTLGLIDRQHEDEKRLENLELRVNQIEKSLTKEVTDIKDVSKTENIKSLTRSEILKNLKEYGIVVLIAILILKDVIGFQSLLDFFLKK